MSQWQDKDAFELALVRLKGILSKSSQGKSYLEGLCERAERVQVLIQGPREYLLAVPVRPKVPESVERVVYDQVVELIDEMKMIAVLLDRDGCIE